jgi:hypothetical protein
MNVFFFRFKYHIFYVLCPFLTLLSAPRTCTSHFVACCMQARETYSDYSSRVLEGLLMDTIRQCDGMHEPTFEIRPIYGCPVDLPS